MTKEDREYAGTLKRFLKTQNALLATKALEEVYMLHGIDDRREQVKAMRAFLTALRAEMRAERKILVRVTKELAAM